jgi:hypothetical protein
MCINNVLEEGQPENHLGGIRTNQLQRTLKGNHGKYSAISFASRPSCSYFFFSLLMVIEVIIETSYLFTK